jgi:hypothetical protein
MYGKPSEIKRLFEIMISQNIVTIAEAAKFLKSYKK